MLQTILFSSFPLSHEFPLDAIFSPGDAKISFLLDISITEVSPLVTSPVQFSLRIDNLIVLVAVLDRRGDTVYF